MKLFIIEIEILENCYDYRVGQIIFTIIESNSEYHAQEKFMNKYWGSEFPSYNILKVQECDYRLFNPNKAIK